MEKERGIKIAIIGSPTLGTPTEISDMLHKGNSVTLVGIEGIAKDKVFKLTRTINNPILFKKPITRAERRKLKK